MSNFLEDILGDFPFAGRLRELRAQLEQRTQEIGRLTSQIDVLLSAQAGARDELARYESALAEATMARKALDKDLRTERTARDAAVGELQDKIRRLVKVTEATNAALLNRDKQLTRLADEHNAASVARDEELAKLAETHNAALRAREEELAKAIAGNSAALKARDEALSKLAKANKEALEAHQRAEEGLREEVRKSLDVISAANQRLAQKDDELRQERDQRRSDNDAAAVARADAEHLRSALTGLRAQVEAHTATEQTLREKIEQLIERRDQVKSVVQNTSEELERAKSALAMAQTELKNEREQNAKDLEALRARRVEADAQRAETKTLLQQAQHALAEERKLARDLTSALDREIAERARLAADVSRDPTRLRLAQAEESIHFHLARALDQSEPAALNSARDDGVGYAQLVERTVQAAVAAGAVPVARPRKAPGLDTMTPEAFGAHHGANPNSWALAVDEAPPSLSALSTHAPNAGVLRLSDAVLRYTAGIALDPAVGTSAPEEPVKRALLIVSEDDAIAEGVLGALGAIAGVAAAPAIPAALLQRADADQMSFDDWLNTVIAGLGGPKFFALRMNADTLLAVKRQAERGRCPEMQDLLRGARVMHLVWSDKCLGVAHRQLRGMAANLQLDDGDARMSLPLYRDAVARDANLERVALTGGLLRPVEIVKAYIELTNEFGVSDFCRDAGFAVKPARIAEESNTFDYIGDASAAAFAKRIRAAAEARTKAYQPVTEATSQVVLARALERAGRYAEAQQAYEEAVRIAPNDVDALIAAARYRELSGQSGEAETLLRKGLDNTGAQQTLVPALREFYRRAGNVLQELALAHLAAEDESPDAMLNLAFAAMKAGEIDQAADAVSQLQALPKPPPLGALPAFVTLHCALPALREAAQNGGASALFALAETLRQLDQSEEALEVYHRAIAADASAVANAWQGAAPNFLVIGPPRTATTLLRNLLELHPQIGLPEGESAFLTNERPVSIGDFAARFTAVRQRKASAQILGDKSPQHFTASEAHVALAALLLPNARIVVTTRDPVERAWSEIKHAGFERAMDANILAALTPDARPAWLEQMLDPSRYQKHLQKWVRHFGAERVLVLSSDDLERDVVRAAQHLFAWLGVPPPPRNEIERLQGNWSNRTAGYALSPALGALLKAAVGGEAHKPEELGAAIKRSGRSA